MKTNFPIIESVRGFSAMGICLFHYVCCTTGYIQNQFTLDTFNLLSLNVEIFFIISSIVITLSLVEQNFEYRDIKYFFLKRLLRIEIPYVASLILAVAYLNLRNHISTSAQVDLSPSLNDILLHLGYLIPFFDGKPWINPVYWSLSVEFQYYIAIAILFPLLSSQKNTLRATGYAAILIPNLITHNHSFFFSWSSYFLLGIIYTLWRKKIATTIEASIVFIIACIVVSKQIGNHELGLGLAVIASVHFFSSYSNSILNHLGKISFSIYLMHSITGGAVINFLSHHFYESWQKPFVILFGIAICLSCSWLFYKLIERPSMNWSKKIKYNR
jgi:peptidoglycan/LPS O-acetylase OafA/YrhL